MGTFGLVNMIHSYLLKFSTSLCREFHLNSQPVRNKKKIEKTHAKEKQSHAQDNIYVIRQFAYVHRVTGISLLSGKSTKSVATIFFTTAKKHGNNRIKP